MAFRRTWYWPTWNWRARIAILVTGTAPALITTKFFASGNAPKVFLGFGKRDVKRKN